MSSVEKSMLTSWSGYRASRLYLDLYDMTYDLRMGWVKIYRSFYPELAGAVVEVSSMREGVIRTNPFCVPKKDSMPQYV